ncbi:MAG: LysR family transcriptional regulator [Gammaproteobacteria bacterium]|nr:LysR family transcriptional regulator [Gammaproteobacteria bacterium]MBT8109884.1 LysR family transcriptional regulator [Gammaproteobacteria bacterium]NND48541.1 LysR family transcriptional regulator [Woeseiaceae bacterium]NNL44586.1 LysR family transcriptional regulator [Woeseiaceae bacterium]
MISKQKMSLRGLRTFCVAARYESFRTASEELFITASAVSHQIKSLEEELGEQLFDRTGRDISLTEIGSLLYEEASPLIEQLNTVVAKYKKGAVKSSIRISVQPFFASEYFVPRLSEFTAEHPEIDIQVGTSDESSEKHPSDADLSIRLFRAPPANMPSNLLFPLRMVPAGSPEFKKAMVVKKKKIVSDFPIIVHETRPKAWTHWADAAGVELPENSKVTRLDSMIAIVRAAQRGIGAALVPVPIGDLWFKEGSIVRLFKKEYVADVSYYLVCTEDRADDESVVLLRDWIVRNFADST